MKNRYIGLNLIQKFHICYSKRRFTIEMTGKGKITATIMIRGSGIHGQRLNHVLRNYERHLE